MEPTRLTRTAEEAITLLGWENVDWDGVVRQIGETMNQEAGAEEVDWDEVVQD